MTIKHAIPNIEWAIELLYNSVRQDVSELEIRVVGVDVVGKANTQQKAPSGPPMELEIREVGDKMW